MMILAGRRVLDFTQYLAGSTVTRLMAEIGAEIIKIELARSGDPSRGLRFADHDRSGAGQGLGLAMSDGMFHMQDIARSTLRRIEDPLMGPLASRAFPLRFSAQPELPALVAPLLGEYNAQVPEGLLGYSAAEVAQRAARDVSQSANR